MTHLKSMARSAGHDGTLRTMLPDAGSGIGEVNDFACWGRGEKERRESRTFSPLRCHLLFLKAAAF